MRPETAEEPSPASTSEDSPTIERRIGGKVAALAGVIVCALWNANKAKWSRRRSNAAAAS